LGQQGADAHVIYALAFSLWLVAFCTLAIMYPPLLTVWGLTVEKTPLGMAHKVAIKVRDAYAATGNEADDSEEQDPR
jgi:hypothetical protein